MRKSCLENYCNRDLLCWRFPLEEASELGFLSIKVSLLVFLLSLFYCFFGNCRNIYFFAYIIYLVPHSSIASLRIISRVSLNLKILKSFPFVGSGA